MDRYLGGFPEVAVESHKFLVSEMDDPDVWKDMVDCFVGFVGRLVGD